MNFDVTTTEWQEIENLTDDKTYILQSKSVIDTMFYKNYSKSDILFFQGASIPEDNKSGMLGFEFKFTKLSGNNVYIKALNTPINIQIDEVQ